MNDYYQTPSELYLREQNEKKEIKYLSRVAGCCVIGYVLIQNILSFLLYSTPLGNLYDTNVNFQSVVSIFFSLFGMMIPFGIGGYLSGKRTKTNIFNFEKPVSAPLMLAAVPLGFFVCLIGNFVTSNFVTLMENIGIRLTSPEYPVPSDTAGRIVYAVSIAVVPALVEEFAIRGAILQPLRRYGDKFAIIASSIIFAVLHGNLIQAPFALIAGIGIGYAVCITNSIWTGVLIHFCNNLYSVITEFMIEDIADEAVLNRIYIIMMITLYFVSILGSVIFVVLKNRRKLMPSFNTLTQGRKMHAFLITLPMIIAFLIMLNITSYYVEIG